MSARTFPPADLPVVISSWEIECCAPPPVVGEFTTWRLIFEPVATPDPRSWDRVPGSVSALQWQVEPWSTDGESTDGDRRALYRNGVAAFYRPLDSTADLTNAPLLGRHLLRGEVSGTKHGGFVDDGFPTVTARVSRIQVISVEFRVHGQNLTQAPGSTRLTEVQQSPKWFTHRPSRLAIDDASKPGRHARGRRRRDTRSVQVYRAESGVLLTLQDADAST